MRARLQTISDRLVNMVAPKAAASAVSCWQSECVYHSCAGRTTAYWWVDPCNDLQKWGACGCRIPA
ncbi:hypothetical protein ACFWMG_23705 [Streptomyces sp. NPDC127074]|uniref:hypothetical protein n=1 Tax=Streptomyces sp. NPDC127074 TaxID=3347130 RepID=UPI0036635DF0